MSLRNNLIKLAYENPELRKELLPLLKEFSDPESQDENKPESFYGLAPRGVQASSRKFIDPKHLTQAAALHSEAGKLAFALSQFAEDARKKYDDLEDLREKLRQDYIDAAIRSGSTENPDFLGDDWSDTPEASEIREALNYYDEFLDKRNPVVGAAAQLESDLKYLADPTEWNRIYR